LLARTTDTTNNPYLTASLEIKKGNDPYKQVKTEETKAEEPVEELKENIALYFSGFDRRTKDVDIQEFLDRWGKYKDFQLLNDAETGRHRGTGFVLFEQLKTTQQALRESGKYSLHGRKIYFSKANKGAIQGGKLATQNSECWFCLDNPNVAKDLIVFLGDNLYVALDKGPINQHHLLIIPIDHYSNALSLPLKVSDELQILKGKIAERYERQYGELVIFYERYMRVTHNIAHMIVNAVPFKRENFAMVVEDIEKKMAQARYNIFEMKPEEKLSEMVLEHEYYFYLELINPESKQKNQYYAKRYLLIMKEKEIKSFPKDFGRELCCDIFNCRNRIDWKNCILNENETKSLSLEIKKLLNK
jgi:diadenosine tetraphosphate (Ap4A) HIT family hydrolase